MFATLLTLAMGAGAFDVASANSSVEQALKESTSSDNFNTIEDKNSRLNKNLKISSGPSLIVSKDSSMSLSAEVERASFVDNGAMVSLGNGTLSPTLSGGEGEKANLSVGEVAVVGDSRTNAGEGNVTSAREGADATHDTAQVRGTDTFSVSGTSESLNINTQKASIYALDKSDRQNKIAHKSDITPNEVGGRTLTADSHTFTSAQTGAGSDSTLAPIESGIVNRALPERAIGSIAFSTFSLSEAQDLKVLNEAMTSSYALGEALALNSESYSGELAYGSSDIQSVGELSLNNYGLSFGTDKVDSIEVLEYEPLTSFEYNIKADKEDTKLLSHIAKVLGDISGRKALSQKVNTILDKPDNRYNELYSPVNKVLVAKEGQTLSPTLSAGEGEKANLSYGEVNGYMSLSVGEGDRERVKTNLFANAGSTYKSSLRGVPTGFASGTRHVVSSGQTVSTISDNFSGNTITNTAGGFISNSGTIGQVIADVVGNTINTNTLPSLITNSSTITSITGIFANNIVNYTASNDSDESVVIENHGIIDTIDADFINNKMNAASYGASPQGTIYTYGTINHIYGSFIGNNIIGGNTTNASWGTFGAAIATNASAVIGDIDATFIGNYAINNTASKPAGGGAIHFGQRDGAGSETIGSVNGTFINNYVQTTSGTAQGGAIDNYLKVTIGSIGTASNPAQFIGNYAKSTSGAAYGGAIYNQGTITGDIIADFVNNSTQAANISRGGAIFNSGSISGVIRGDFIGNSTNGYYAQGGAIWNEGGTISGIEGDFINNKVTSAVDAKGSAIFNHNNANIGYIKGDFIGNSAVPTADSMTYLKEGAIVNSSGSTIGSIEGNFINNSIISDYNIFAVGAAVRNVENGTITSIGKESKHSLFYNNVLKGAGAAGSAIMNDSTITSLYGDFINNKSTATGQYDTNGAIFNVGGTIGHLEGAFIGNSASGNLNDPGYEGGAGIMTEGGVVNTYNSIFMNNSVSGSYVNGSAIINYGGTIKLTDTSFYHNKNLSNDYGAISTYGNATTGIIANTADVLFYGNKGVNNYIDFNNSSALNLNAGSGRQIRFGGSVLGSGGTININNGIDSAPTGGKYIFGSRLSGNTVNLYNGANVRFTPTRQTDGTVTYGMYNAVATTNDANGGYLNFANQNTDDYQYFGALTLASDLKIGMDYDIKSNQQLKDGLNATSVNAQGHHVLIDYINMIGDTGDVATGTVYNMGNFLTNNLYSAIAFSDTLKINSAY